jgi:uncharacterized coiled-coil protein SlyX
MSGCMKDKRIAELEYQLVETFQHYVDANECAIEAQDRIKELERQVADARNAALEEAAGIVKSRAPLSWVTNRLSHRDMETVALIRALKAKPTP